ncbi:MAG: NAD(P)-dependent oxidoreductase, partial [Planctomycetota bacterium]
LLSILVPAEAEAAARRVADALRRTGRRLLYVDCNAIAPDTARSVSEIIAAAGGTCIDAGIIGPPPTREGITRFYASGQRADEFAALEKHGLDVRVLGTDIGQGSGFKMCYAALTKGTAALAIAQLVAAARLGLYEPLVAELQQSQPDRYSGMAHSLPGTPAKAGRWIGEMEEIARTLASVGAPPGFHVGAADVYRLVQEAFPGGFDAKGDTDVALAEFIRRLARVLVP